MQLHASIAPSSLTVKINVYVLSSIKNFDEKSNIKRGVCYFGIGFV